jgi:hypothetical protein
VLAVCMVDASSLFARPSRLKKMPLTE